VAGQVADKVDEVMAAANEADAEATAKEVKSDAEPVLGDSSAEATSMAAPPMAQDPIQT